MTANQRTKDTSVATQLTELIHNLSEADQQALLNILEERQNPDRRKHPRKSCSIPVDYAIGDRTYKDLIKNMSASGAFIETQAPFSIGQEISMNFASTKFDEPVKIKGRVFWVNTVGIGVKFMTEDQAIITMLEGL
jgi:hypothetical protein